jgi:hypothetical protein
MCGRIRVQEINRRLHAVFLFDHAELRRPEGVANASPMRPRPSVPGGGAPFPPDAAAR